jgi:DNA primase catalytic core
VPKIDFDAIKRTVDVAAVIEGYGVTLKKEGRDYVGLCPFHDDTQPSLRVTPGKGLWRCMSCEATGNAIQFVARKEGITDKEAALKLLATLPGVKRAAQLEEKKSIIVPANIAADLLNRVAAFYHRTLFKDKAGLDYMASRNLADPAMLETFRIGYCNGTLKNALPKSGEVIGQLQALGILNAKGNEVFYGRITVPITDGGNVVSFYGRKVEPGKLSAESSPHMYLAGGHKAAFNANAAKSAERVLFTEAVFDALSLWQAGHRAAVPLYGKDGWTAYHDKLLSETTAREIVLALDNDEAGRRATAQLKEKILSAKPACAVRVLTWPEGVKDANAFFSGSHAEALAKAGSPLSDKFAALLGEPKATTGEEKSSTGEKLEPRDGGFALAYPNRRYEVIAVEKTGATRLRATVKALGLEPGRFHVETIDLYSAKARRLFAAEAARLFRLPEEVTEGDLSKILLATENTALRGAAGQSAGAGAAPLPLSAQDKEAAQKLGRSVDLIGEIQRDLGKLGLIGEETNRLLLYLAMTSRKMDDPLAVHILSSSGAGKSYLQDAVLSLCPEEDLIKLTALTDQALFYKGEDSLRHKCLAVEEVAGAEGARYAVRNLISAKKLSIEATIKNPLTGKMETQVNTVYGPTAVFETTTQPGTDAETKSRFILLSIDESPEQTRLIVAAQRERHTLDAMIARKERAAIWRRHHAFQRSLRPLCVVNPYEPLLGYGDERLSTRRDQPKYLNLILAVAFVHQMKRPVRHHPLLGDYIEATLDDIAIANELATELFGASLDDLSAPGRRLAGQLADYVRTRGKNHGWEKMDFGRRDLRAALKWSDTRLRVHLAELVQLEYVQPVCGANGSAYRYRLAVAPEEILSGGRFVPGLKSVEQLQKEANLAGLDSHLAAKNGHPAGQNGHPAATSPVQNGGVGNGASLLTAGRKVSLGRNLAAFNGEHIPALNGSHG